MYSVVLEPSEVSKIFNLPFTLTKNVKIVYKKDELKRVYLVTDDICHLLNQKNDIQL